MRFSLQREALLKPLAQVVNVVERRQTLPVLGNLLVQVKDGYLALTGTDLEVEMMARTALDGGSEDGETTIPARKLFDIVRALPDGAKITLTLAGDKATIQGGRSRFTLATLPANDFPSADNEDTTERAVVPESALKELIDRTSFAMAQQDVRYYLNGLLFDLRGDILRCVATDGHRLALCEAPLEGNQHKRQIIVPRKGVNELQRMLEGGDREIELEIGRTHIRVVRDDATFTSKLIDGKFPDYEAVIPIGADKLVTMDREALRAALQRVAILSNEKYRGVRLETTPNQLQISSHNPEQEEAQEDVEVETKIEDITIGFNVTYLLDALSALRDEKVVLALRDANSSALLREASNERSRHVVMPLRL